MAPSSVVKVGGSLLRQAEDYARVAQALLPRLAAGSAWVVVSAAKGTTDALEAVAAGREQAGDVLAAQSRLWGGPLPAHLSASFQAALSAARAGEADALMAWGELASAELLARHLEARGVRLPVVELRPAAPPPALPHAVVPGFFVRGETGALRILPRGGSDISAVLVARWIGAGAVRLWKEGGGIRLQPGVTVEQVDAATLLQWLGDRVRPIHPSAVRLALEAGLDLVLEDPWGADGRTRVTSHVPPPASPAQRIAGEAAP